MSNHEPDGLIIL